MQRGLGGFPHSLLHQDNDLGLLYSATRKGKRQEEPTPNPSQEGKAKVDVH
ncbi:hypothetical protein [Moorena sp. SIO4G3]|uniref:hypothetical protein n=1 Tax=Moorena sp. SIO4G3 TaxID=2607821 RepID=UPI0014295326|nr:hypothetical protein [Moorena sp. SIO4G3]NEO78346.1 hypothetical protein [Moorena sp. SIO4G3]